MDILQNKHCSYCQSVTVVNVKMNRSTLNSPVYNMKSCFFFKVRNRPIDEAFSQSISIHS